MNNTTATNVSSLPVPAAFMERIDNLGWKELPHSGERQLWLAETLYGDWYIRRVADAFVPDTIHGYGDWSSESVSAPFFRRPKQCTNLCDAKNAVSQFLRDDLVKIAYHEAGHLLAALRLEIPLRADRAATIIPDGDCKGKTYFRDADKPFGQLEAGIVENYCVCLLSGRAADIVRREGWSERGSCSIEEPDYTDVTAILEWLVPELPEEWAEVGFREDELKARLLLLELRAARLVKANWTSVAALACGLLDRGTLSATEAKDVLK